MPSIIYQKKDTNPLLRWLILVSLLIHIPIYLHMNGLLTTKILDYIDLTINNAEDSSGPKILRPPILFKEKNNPGKAKASFMTPVHVPENNQLYKSGTESINARVSNTGTVPYPGTNKINFTPGIGRSSSEMEFGSGVGLSSSGLGAGVGNALTKEGYLEMVRRKIERNNKFPPEAAEKAKGGVVVVQFVINLDGTISDLKILKPSHLEALNRQALQAVRDSAPFIKPPSYIFKEPILIPLNVYFNVNVN